MRHTYLVVILGVVLAGCQSIPRLDPTEEVSYSPPELDYTPPPTSSGGVFRAGYGGLLTQDRRALRVGDVLTVVLDESTQSSKSAGTSIGRSSDVGVGVPRVFGRDYSRAETSFSADRSFDGNASSKQANALRGSIAVTVHEVLPNGVLVVKGEKWLRLNQGDEFIRLSGLVRLEDVNRYNQVLSQNIANAQISYAGRGALSDSNRPGWLTRLFNHPIFPF
ncbi:flagellar basal body L-ring protein [Alkalilimnicola ehrlichii]|uniref:Flagellar L-ring protein n=1 Tax=Alkalilimnicola ehrlichii TaxID=351052 RepID=A0A3E0X1W0_9GAMM|nr:flagellar basal body L-ring protein FlgH [Alkalilimnicola ehrlichii]RFA30736.1 flagellar basal body L-ring protein [Alkalilimnicola ehrlichii]RFA38312.1 flagellar basal body L-ring protein [Alkalilimnicola ehrlichii]